VDVDDPAVGNRLRGRRAEPGRGRLPLDPVDAVDDVRVLAPGERLDLDTTGSRTA